MLPKTTLRTHIPRDELLTYCGKVASSVICIDVRAKNLEDATCLNCQRNQMINGWMKKKEGRGTSNSSED